MVDFAKTCGKASLDEVWTWAMYFDFPQRVLRVLCGYFAHERTVMLEHVSDPNSSHYGDLAGINMVGALAEDCYAGCHEMCLLLFLRIKDLVHVNDMKFFLNGISMDLPERTRKLSELLK